MTKKAEKIKLWERNKSRDRWITAIVFFVSLVLTLGFWWIGGLKDKLNFNFGSESTVWRRMNLEGESFEDIDYVNSDNLSATLESKISDLNGEYVIYAKSLSRDVSWFVAIGEIDNPLQAASLIKVPVMVSVVRLADKNAISLDNLYELKQSDKVGGSGSLFSEPVGYHLSWRKLLWHMGNESDNTAFNITMNYWGEDNINSELEKMGFLKTDIKNNEITAWEIGSLFEGLYRGRWVDDEMGKELMDSMVNTWYEDYIPDQVPLDVRVVHKVGIDKGVINDAGIIYAEHPYLLVIMSENVLISEAEKVIPDLSETVWNWVNNL